MPRALAMVLVAFLALGQNAAADDRLANQRELFRDARDRIAQGRAMDIDALEQRLSGYPLTAYLQHDYLLRAPGRLDAGRARAFLDAHGGSPVGQRFRYRWLHELGRRADWQEFLHFYRGGGGATLQCYALQARRAARGVDDRWLARARELWLVGQSQPRACDPVFAELYQRDVLTREQRWERITRSMHAGNADLALALRRRLHPDDRPWLDHWLAVARDPATALEQPEFAADTRRGRQLVRFGLQRLARSDRDAARSLLAAWAERGVLSDGARTALRREIALRSAYSRDEDALERLQALPQEAVNDEVREWRARAAVRQQDWEAALAAIADLAGTQRQTGEWRYWQAQALWRTGERERARDAFRELAGERHYYGFLAADAIGRSYAMNPRQPEAEPEKQARLADRPGLRRARELLRVGMISRARREWITALAGDDADTRAQAAMLARDWGWYDRAIRGANGAGLHDALGLRFPAGFRETLTAAAEAEGLDPALVFAVARKESAFSPDARSRAGALGLLQVMPATGRRVARDLGLSLPSAADLLDPATNARLGAAYLRQMLERFDGNVILAAAAYNAGPRRAQQWAEDNAGQPAAVWIENITYGETRDYVKSVLAFRAVFDWQLHGESRRLAGLMPAMPGGGELAMGGGLAMPSGRAGEPVTR
ncbi:transglycosylase SLT domain-containing protein [Aquisalimonas lutea]|uniref:transglycosylase SLT domain-containing protein n=1 Tax=Aquisalimonas lutea TaxID=1327750 RepID=UPI0025B56156|nr:transglycosylase SLT domain-containing protein [Aquisalimonas lutea]MDN3516999.1 transglycosylase SLT domain-containing protein [Aquisalimonas lutea]